jgi:hypothetical protein
LSKLDEIIKRHPNFKKEVRLTNSDLIDNDGIISAKFKHQSDDQIEINITFMVFDFNT